MPVYTIKAIAPFVDMETGAKIHIGDKIRTESKGRLANIVAQGLGELVEARHENKHGKRILVHQDPLAKIGGIETAQRHLVKAFKDHDITFVFGHADQDQLMEIANNCSVILDDGKSRYETDILLLMNFYSAGAIIDRVKAEKVYQFIHADWDGLKQMPMWQGFKWAPHSRVDRVLAVSETAKEGLKKAFGVESVVVPNILMPPEEQKRLVFVVLSRASAEKGIDRLLEMVQRFDLAQKDYVVILCSAIEQTQSQYRKVIETSNRILLIPPTIYSQELLRSADYLVQLSRNESYCYSVREALQMRVPVIASKIPEFQKLIKNGQNGYILEDDLSNLDVDKIFNKIPKPKAYREEIAPIWNDVLEGKL